MKDWSWIKEKVIIYLQFKKVVICYCTEKYCLNLPLSKLPHQFFQWLGSQKEKECLFLVIKKQTQKKTFKSTVDNILIPVSIFSKARFVMWKNPSFMRRNTWYIPVNQKHTILNSDSENLQNNFQNVPMFQVHMCNDRFFLYSYRNFTWWCLVLFNDEIAIGFLIPTGWFLDQSL